MDLLLLAAMVRMALGAGRREASFYLLLASALCLLVTDTWYSLVLIGAPDPGPFLDIGWACFYILWGAAALHPSMRTMEERAAQPPASNRARRTLLLVAALSTPCLQLIQSLRGQSIASPVAAAASILLIVLVFARLNDLFVDIDEHRKTEEGLEHARARYQGDRAGRSGDRLHRRRGVLGPGADVVREPADRLDPRLHGGGVPARSLAMAADRGGGGPARAPRPRRSVPRQGGSVPRRVPDARPRRRRPLVPRRGHPRRVRTAGGSGRA
jgi:hypothetical protein